MLNIAHNIAHNTTTQGGIMNDFYKFLSDNQDSITTGTAQRLADDLGITLDLDLIA